MKPVNSALQPQPAQCGMLSAIHPELTRNPPPENLGPVVCPRVHSTKAKRARYLVLTRPMSQACAFVRVGGADVKDMGTHLPFTQMDAPTYRESFERNADRTSAAVAGSPPHGTSSQKSAEEDYCPCPNPPNLCPNLQNRLSNTPQTHPKACNSLQLNSEFLGPCLGFGSAVLQGGDTAPCLTGKLLVVDNLWGLQGCKVSRNCRVQGL